MNITVFHSPKGGSGTTTVTAATAIAARFQNRGVNVAAVEWHKGDLFACAGMADPGSTIVEYVTDGLAFIRLDGDPAGIEDLMVDFDEVYVDAGTDGDLARHLVEFQAARLVLVTRPCYLALRRVPSAQLRYDAIVLVNEPGRALGRSDVENVVGAPVIATVPVEPGIARIVDAGLLISRVPQAFTAAARHITAVPTA